MQPLDVISVNLWHILISLINLLIIFFIVKKFLFKPINKMLKERKEKIDKEYSDAYATKREAEEAKRSYDEKKAELASEAEQILARATVKAEKQGAEIVRAAKSDAEGILRQANEEIKNEKSAMLNAVKNEVSVISVELASKIVEREVNAQDHTELINEFIAKIGENDD